jgi:hypothetical protein
MKTITMDIDEVTLSRAEQKAAALDTSVNKVVSEYLRQWADEGEIRQARAAMTERFAKPNWQFAVGTSDDREQRNART